MKATREQLLIALEIISGDSLSWIWTSDQAAHDTAVSLGLLAAPTERLFRFHCRNLIAAALAGEDMPGIEDSLLALRGMTPRVDDDRIGPDPDD